MGNVKKLKNYNYLKDIERKSDFKMGKNKKGYNWRARQNVSGNIDNSDTIKLASKIDVDDQQKVDIDSSNALVLPSKKRKFKATADTQPIGKILSKKKRKH